MFTEVLATDLATYGGDVDDVQRRILDWLLGWLLLVLLVVTLTSNHWKEKRGVSEVYLPRWTGKTWSMLNDVTGARAGLDHDRGIRLQWHVGFDQWEHGKQHVAVEGGGRQCICGRVDTKEGGPSKVSDAVALGLLDLKGCGWMGGDNVFFPPHPVIGVSGAWVRVEKKSCTIGTS